MKTKLGKTNLDCSFHPRRPGHGTTVWSVLCAGAVLSLGLMSEEPALGGAGRGGGGGSGRVQSPGIGAPGAGTHGAGATPGAGAGTPGAGARGAGATPGAGAAGAGATPGVGAGARGAGVAPGAGVGAPGTAALPRGYYYTVPTGWAKVYYGGYWCAYVNGVYYRPVYYQGVVVYVVVP